MRIVFMGTPEFAVTSLEHLLLNKYEVVAVYTQPDRPAGRGRTLVVSPVKKVALARGLPVLQPSSLKKAETIAELAAFQPDAIVVAAYGQLLPQAVLDIPRYGCINIHGSLLPKFRGAAPIAAAILAGEEFTGISIMLMEASLDTGPVLTRAAIPIFPHDTTVTLTAKLSEIAARAVQDALVRRARGEITPQPQNEAEATYAPAVIVDQGAIDWRMPAVELWRRVRAFQPWPGCYTRWEGKRLKITEAAPLPAKEGVGVGQVVALEGKSPGIGVGTGDGVLGLLRLQLEGKQEMAATDFARGHRQFVGSVLR